LWTVVGCRLLLMDGFLVGGAQAESLCHRFRASR